jgi:endonuclease I
MRRTVVALVLAIGLCAPAVAQQQSLFPGLSGAALLDSLVHNYKTDYTYSYNRARDSMFAAVYLESDSVACIYTGWKVYIDRNSSTAPRTQAHNQNVHTEHTWPQSLGASSGHANKDLHHLFPIRSDVNSSRGNKAFAEIDAGDATRWWYLNQSPTTAPSPPHDLWSRTSTGLDRFDVRADNRGRVARAMFYFYTMYRAEADAADPAYFDVQKDVLYRWHRQTPPDALEHSRTQLIASYQAGRANPFVLDSTLVRRAYFPTPPAPLAFDAVYEFTGTTGCTTENLAVTTQPSDAAFGDLTRAGIVCNQGTAVFNSRSWSTAASRSDAVYAEFTVTASGGRTLTFGTDDALSFQSQRSSTGPSSAEVRYSVDGGAFVSLGTWSPPTSSASTSFVMPAITGASNVVFRLYGWNAGGSTGTLRFDDVRLTGETRAAGSLLADEMPAAGFALESIYPNPSHGVASVTYTLPTEAVVSVSVYDVLGRRVAVLVDGESQQAGPRVVNWNGQGLASGLYLVRATFVPASGAAGHAARRVTLVR